MNFENYLEFDDMLTENSLYDDFERDEHKIFGLNENGNTYIDCIVNVIESKVPDINDISEKKLDAIINKVIFPDNVKNNTVSDAKIKNVVESYIGLSESEVAMLYNDEDIEVIDDDDEVDYDPDLDDIEDDDIEVVEPINEEEPGKVLQDDIEDDMKDEVIDSVSDDEGSEDPAVNPEGEDYEDLDDPISTEDDNEVSYDPDIDDVDDDDVIEYEIDSEDDIDDIYYDPDLDTDDEEDF